MKHLLTGTVILICTSGAQAQFAEPNERGVTFAHMHVVVAERDLHTRLWPELFDVELVEKQGYSAVRLDNALVFFREAEPDAPSWATTLDHFGLKVRDLDAIVSQWRSLGYEIDPEATDPRCDADVFITMPGGIRLALDEVPEQSASAAMGHVHFAAPPGGESLAWYVEHFGAADDGSRIATVPGTGLQFDTVGEGRLPTDGAAIDHIGFEVREWEGFVSGLEQAGIRFEFGPLYIESLDLWVAFFNDPSGVLVEITHGLDHF